MLKKNEKHLILIITLIIAAGIFVYLPQQSQLGLYRDDWNNFYNLTVRGPKTLIAAYNADRPADGYLISFLYSIFDSNIRAYFIWNLCCRIMGAVFLALAIYTIYPESPYSAALVGILAIVFPGFLQQVDGIAYIPHQTAMFCFMLSLFLTALSFKTEKRILKITCIFAAVLCSFTNMILMEYYIGMEAYRIGLLYVIIKNKNKEKKFSYRLKYTLLSYFPYIFPVFVFLVWRLFLFDASRTGTNFIEDIINPFLASPLHKGADLFVRTIKSVWKLFAAAWTVPAYNLINNLSVKEFINSLIPSLVVSAILMIGICFLPCKDNDKSALLIWFGLISGSAAILPMIAAGRDINYTASLDRFSWVGMTGAILFLVGLFSSLRSKRLYTVLVSFSLLTSIFVQWQNQKNYANLWKSTKDYWQQMIWRAPSLEKGTTIVSGGSLLVEEDYDIFAPASMIYYPEEKEYSPIGAEVLNTGTIQDIILGKNKQRTIREIHLEKNYDKLIAVTKPSDNSCLRIIDGSNPIYSPNDWTKIPSIGSYSNLSQIIIDAEEPAIPFFLEKEQEHGWCYYYEKMELALQSDDAYRAAELADDALALGFKPRDIVEWIPVIEAYTETEQIQKAIELSGEIHSDEFFRYNACLYFKKKQKEQNIYSKIIPFVCEP